MAASHNVSHYQSAAGERDVTFFLMQPNIVSVHKDGQRSEQAETEDV